jgi:hypothetical protein
LSGLILHWNERHHKMERRLRRIQARHLQGVAHVFYPSVRSLTRTFAPESRLRSVKAIGVSVPPSYLPIRQPRVDAFAVKTPKCFSRVTVGEIPNNLPQAGPITQSNTEVPGRSTWPRSEANSFRSLTTAEFEHAIARVEGSFQFSPHGRALSLADSRLSEQLVIVVGVKGRSAEWAAYR